MADVALPPGISRQVALVAGLRWRLFRNALRKTSEWLDLIALLLASTLGGLFVAGAGFGLGVAAHFLVARGHVELLALPMLAVFAFWQFLPVMLATSTTGFDFRNFLRFPLRYPAFFLLSLAYGLSDPAAVGSLLWLACITTGIVLARPELLPWTLLVMVVFAAVNLVLSRMVFSWLERLMARRRSREAMIALLLLLLLSVQLFSAVGARVEKRVKPYAGVALAALRLTPPGLAGKAVGDAAQGNAASAIASTAGLLAYSMAFGWLLHRRLWAQYLGEDLGETQAPSAPGASARPAVLPGSFGSSWLPGRVAAMFEKEFRYLFRNSMAALQLVLPLILILLLSFSFARPRPGRTGTSQLPPELVFPAAAAYMFLILAPLAQNSFAYDGRGVQLLLAAPVRFRDVLLGKNLVFGMIIAAETVLVWLEIAFLFRPPDVLFTITTIAALLFATLLNCVIGNWLSLQFPRRFEFGSYRRRASGVSVLVGLAFQIVLIGLRSEERRVGKECRL